MYSDTPIDWMCWDVLVEGWVGPDLGVIPQASYVGYCTPWKINMETWLGSGFKYFLFSPLPGKARG